MASANLQKDETESDQKRQLAESCDITTDANPKAMWAWGQSRSTKGRSK